VENNELMSVASVPYKSMVRPILDDGLPVCCLHLMKYVSHLDSVQQHAA